MQSYNTGFVWNWGVSECRRALDAGVIVSRRIPSVFVRCSTRSRASWRPWSRGLSQNDCEVRSDWLGQTLGGTFWSALGKSKKTGKKLKFRPPRFKKRKAAKQTFRADNGPGTVRTCGKTIRLPRIGKVRIRETCRFEGPIRECTVKYDGVRWYAVVVCEVPAPEPKESGVIVGVDVGLRRLATVYDGERFEVFENLRPLKRALGALRAVNRRVARSRKIHGKSRHSSRRERMYEKRRQSLREGEPLADGQLHTR